MSGDAPLTGRKVLAIAVAAFGVVIAANLVLAWQAVGTFPGTETANSYVASQNFNRTLAEAKAQEFEEQMAALRAQHLFAARQAKQAADAEYVARRDNHRREYERRSYRPHPANRRGAA